MIVKAFQIGPTCLYSIHEPDDFPEAMASGMCPVKREGDEIILEIREPPEPLRCKIITADIQEPIEDSPSPRVFYEASPIFDEVAA